MSLYYKYDFISPEATYALVKEELRSYFDTGMVDETMFPVWTHKALQKMGKSSYQIVPTILQIQNYEARLPDDFMAVREAWSCYSVDKDYQLPTADYNQISSTSTLLSPNLSTTPFCDCDISCSIPGIINVIYKTTNKVLFRFQRQELLTPGNIDYLPDSNPTKEMFNWNDYFYCSKHGDSKHSYDIHGNKFVVRFCEGFVHLLYYSKKTDPAGNQLIPDNYRIKEYITAYLRQKVFEQVFNQTTDESFNQSLQKYQLYKAQADQAYILADLETKKEDVYKKERRTNALLHRYTKYDIR